MAEQKTLDSNLRKSECLGRWVPTGDRDLSPDPWSLMAMTSINNKSIFYFLIFATVLRIRSYRHPWSRYMTSMIWKMNPYNDSVTSSVCVVVCTRLCGAATSTSTPRQAYIIISISNSPFPPPRKLERVPCSFCVIFVFLLSGFPPKPQITSINKLPP